METKHTRISVFSLFPHACIKIWLACLAIAVLLMASFIWLFADTKAEWKEEEKPDLAEMVLENPDAKTQLLLERHPLLESTPLIPVQGSLLLSDTKPVRMCSMSAWCPDYFSLSRRSLAEGEWPVQAGEAIAEAWILDALAIDQPLPITVQLTCKNESEIFQFSCTITGKLTNSQAAVQQDLPAVWIVQNHTAHTEQSFIYVQTRQQYAGILEEIPWDSPVHFLNSSISSSHSTSHIAFLLLFAACWLAALMLLFVQLWGLLDSDLANLFTQLGISRTALLFGVLKIPAFFFFAIQTAGTILLLFTKQIQAICLWNAGMGVLCLLVLAGCRLCCSSHGSFPFPFGQKIAFGALISLCILPAACILAGLEECNSLSSQLESQYDLSLRSDLQIAHPFQLELDDLEFFSCTLLDPETGKTAQNLSSHMMYIPARQLEKLLPDLCRNLQLETNPTVFVLDLENIHVLPDFAGTLLSLDPQSLPFALQTLPEIHSAVCLVSDGYFPEAPPEANRIWIRIPSGKNNPALLESLMVSGISQGYNAEIFPERLEKLAQLRNWKLLLLLLLSGQWILLMLCIFSRTAGVCCQKSELQQQLGISSKAWKTFRIRNAVQTLLVVLACLLTAFFLLQSILTAITSLPVIHILLLPAAITTGLALSLWLTGSILRNENRHA